MYVTVLNIMNYSEVSQPIFIPLSLMDYPMNHGVSCGDCFSACCAEGTVLPLTTDEVFDLCEAGTDMDIYPEDGTHSLTRKERRKGIAFYILQSACGNLELPEDGGPGKCRAFGKPERPLICREFTVGSQACKVIRFERGVGTNIQPGVA
jgi:hypothetical protein